MKRWIIVAIVMAACGGADKQGPTTPDKATPVEKEHAKLTPELDAFHDVLSPRWHADQGEARTKDTCAAQPDMLAKAQAVEAAAAPANVDATAWSAAAAHLTKEVTALGESCAAEPAMFEPTFHSVHEAFHALMEMQMGKHDHAEHGHGEHGAETPMQH
jgi:hypothetical protein